ncbi:MAG: ABC transporter permease subunit [Cucumibacter sp.]
MPDWLTALLGPDLSGGLAYITNGKHLQWYGAFRFTILAGLLGALFALGFGLLGAAAKNARLWPLRQLGNLYTGIVRGVPDVLFFLFFPLAFEQGVEYFLALGQCSAEEVAANPGVWPPCPDANLFFGTTEYLLLACLSLGLIYGAFAANVIHGALRAVPAGQLEAARAFGLSASQVLWGIHVRQMWIYALPGLSNVWMILIKATSLLSLLQIADIVLWADRLGSPNFQPAAGVIHPDWRWRYYLVLFIFYILVTFLSERVFRALTRWAGKGVIVADNP